MKKYIYFFTLLYLALTTPHLTSYTILDTVTLKNGTNVEILKIFPDRDKDIFENGKKVFIESFKDAYKDFNAQELYLENKPDFLNIFLAAAFEDEKLDFLNKKDGTHFIVARTTDKQDIVGFVAHDVYKEKKHVYIRQLAVAPSMQGQNLGEVLADRIIKKIAPDAETSAVCTRIINKRAVNFYKNKLKYNDANMQDVHPELPAYKYQGFKKSLK